jgi:hypothetical protein
MPTIHAKKLLNRQTKQLTLEELDQVFAVPVSKFARYQVTQVGPWWFKRYILWQKSATCPPLYAHEQVSE